MPSQLSHPISILQKILKFLIHYCLFSISYLCHCRILPTFIPLLSLGEILVGKGDKYLWVTHCDLLPSYPLPKSKGFSQEALCNFILFHWKILCSFFSLAPFGGIPTSNEILTDKTEKRNLEYVTTLCLVAQLCLTIAHQAPLSMRILQARILKWVAMPSSRGSSQPRDWIQVSHIAGGFFTIWAAREAQEY